MPGYPLAIIRAGLRRHPSPQQAQGHEGGPKTTKDTKDTGAWPDHYP